MRIFRCHMSSSSVKIKPLIKSDFQILTTTHPGSIICIIIHTIPNHSLITKQPTRASETGKLSHRQLCKTVDHSFLIINIKLSHYCMGNKIIFRLNQKCKNVTSQSSTKPSTKTTSIRTSLRIDIMVGNYNSIIHRILLQWRTSICN